MKDLSFDHLKNRIVKSAEQIDRETSPTEEKFQQRLRNEAKSRKPAKPTKPKPRSMTQNLGDLLEDAGINAKDIKGPYGR